MSSPKDAWGRGFASEALAAMVELTVRLGVPRLAALCHPDHRASQRVLGKGGFVLDPSDSPAIEFPNLAPGVVQPAYVYARTFTAI
jgi:RimJ/RimL family protein N-acetyltransferase